MRVTETTWCAMWKNVKDAVRLVVFIPDDGVPSRLQQWRSYRGDKCMTSDWFEIYMKVSDWLIYNQKRVKAKHNGHLLVYQGLYPSKSGTVFC